MRQRRPNRASLGALMMMGHQSKFSCKRISSSDNILKSNILIILSITVTLTFKTANQSFWKTIWLIMMHHHTKFGSKRFSDSEYIWKSIHWHFAVTLTLNTTIKFLYQTLCLIIKCYQIKFGSKRISCSKDTVDIVIFWSYELPSTLTLKIGNQSFSMTLWLIMMYHKTKFRNKMLGGLEGIIWTNNILTLRYDLYPECSNPFFSQVTLAYNDVSSDQVWLPRNQQFR